MSREFMMARFLHDRFCKFEAPFIKDQVIVTVRLIKEIVPLEVLKEAELAFKLNNLRWFLTVDGKKFLYKSQKRFLLNKEIEKLDFNKIPAPSLNQIASGTILSYNTQNEKYEEDKTYNKQVETIADFLS